MITQSLDTNVLLRAAVDLGDEQTTRARSLLTDPSREFMVCLLVFAEFAHVLRQHYGMDRAQVAKLVRWVLDIESIICARDVVRTSLAMFETHPKLSFEDCLITEQAQANEATPLWTFDEKLARQHPFAKLV